MSLLARCGVSNLPILENENIKLFIIIESFDLVEGLQNIKNKGVLGGISFNGIMKNNAKVKIVEDKNKEIIEKLLKELTNVELKNLIKEATFNNLILFKNKIMLKLSISYIKENAYNNLINLYPENIEKEKNYIIKNFEKEKEIFGEHLRPRYQKIGSPDFNHYAYIYDETTFFIQLKEAGVIIENAVSLSEIFSKDAVFMSKLRLYGLNIRCPHVFDEWYAFDNKTNEWFEKTFEEYKDTKNKIIEE